MVLIILYRISESDDAADVTKKISKSKEPNKLKTKVCAFWFFKNMLRFRIILGELNRMRFVHF